MNYFAGKGRGRTEAMEPGSLANLGIRGLADFYAGQMGSVKGAYNKRNWPGASSR
jgi:hypothetical protein